MLINHDLEYIYIDTPKTGGTSVESVLMRKYNFETVVRSLGWGGDRHNRIIKEECKHYTKIATVRNPYTRTLSQWTFNKLLRDRLDKFNHIQEFVDWLVYLNKNTSVDECIHDICGWFSCSKYLKLPGYDIIIKQEELEQGINNLEFIEEPIKLPNINDSNSKKYNHLLTPNVIAKINEYCEQDFIEFNYKKEKI